MPTSADQLLTLAQGLLDLDSAHLADWDFGYIKSQRADLKVFLQAMQRYYFRLSNTEPPPTDEDSLEATEVVTKWPLVAYLLTAMFCLGCSTTCHLCYVKDRTISYIVSHLDYWGISILFLGSCYPFIAYKYACGPFVVWRFIFTSIITVLTLCSMAATCSTSFMTPKRRAALFTLFAVSCAVPTAGLVIWHDPDYTLEPNLAPYSWALLSYAAGMIIYVTKVPECWNKTGRYDFIGNSHQIWHLFVMLGVAITFVDSYCVYRERLAFLCPEQSANGEVLAAGS